VDLLRHLEFFVTIAEEEHFGRAAGRLGMAQPPISQGLQRLERSLGVVLLERSSRGVRLNAAGRDLLPRARALLQGAEDLRRVAGTYGAAATSLRVGTVPQLSPRVMAAVATACQDRAGGPVEMTTASTSELVDAVTAGQLDLAVVVHPALLGALRSGPVVRLDTELLIPADHPAARTGEPVVLRSLRGLGVAAPPRPHGTAAHDLFLDTIEGGPLGLPYAKLKGGAMIKGDFTPSFPLAHAAKDAGLIIDAAPDLPLPRLVREQMLKAAEAGHGERDMAATFLALSS